MKALSTRNDEPERASRPFDRDRGGFVMSEGAGVVVVEELEHAKARGAKIYCEITGYGLTADAFHMTAPPPDGEGAARAMKLALEHARLSPEQVDTLMHMPRRPILATFARPARSNKCSETTLIRLPSVPRNR